MGYRSDVKALIYPVSGEHNLLNYDKLKTLMNTTFKDVFDAWNDEYFKWNDENRVLEFSADSIKWYDGYPDIQKFAKFLTEVHELEYEYEFIRLGEDMDDIEEDSTGDSQGFLYVSRSIEVVF
jgi:hypothetical protein